MCYVKTPPVPARLIAAYGVENVSGAGSFRMLKCRDPRVSSSSTVLARMHALHGCLAQVDAQSRSTTGWTRRRHGVGGLAAEVERARLPDPAHERTKPNVRSSVPFGRQVKVFAPSASS
jgi:hypothetical protein